MQPTIAKPSLFLQNKRIANTRRRCPMLTTRLFIADSLLDLRPCPPISNFDDHFGCLQSFPCRRSQILLYLELYNLEILQPKLHYLHFQFLRICKKHDTRIFPKNVLWGSVNFHLLPVARPPQQRRLSLRTMRGAPPAAGQQPILVGCERCAATSGGRRAA